MADKILPQRVSAFHSSPQPTPPPTLCCSASSPPTPATTTPGHLPSPQEQLNIIVTFTFLFKVN